MAKYSSVFNLNSGYTLYLEVTETDVSIDKNSSKVKWTLTIESTKSLEYGSFDYDGTPFSVSINNVVVSSGKKVYDFREYKTLKVASGTTNFIQHNTDGSKTVACSATFGASDTPIGKATAKGNLVLTKIPRISTFSVSTEKTKVEDTINLTITSASTSFTHKIGWYYNNNLVGTISSIKNLKSAITVPTALYKTFLENNKNSLKFVLKCGTYSGNTYIGVATKEIVVELSANKCKPIIKSIDIINIADSKLGMTADDKIVLDKNVSLNVEVIYEYNSTSYMTAIKTKKGIQENEPLTQVINNIGLDYSIKINDGILVSDGKTLLSENKYLYYTAPTINIKTPSINFESYYETNAENNTSELKYKITSFRSEIDCNFFPFFPIGKTDLTVFSYRYYIGIQKENISYTESILLSEEDKGKFIISYPSEDLPEEDVVITLDNLLTPLYLIIEYEDEISSAATQTKEIRISPLFDWGESDFKFNIPLAPFETVSNTYFSFPTRTGGAINLKNSDIAGVDKLIFSDPCQGFAEGICFPQSKDSGPPLQTHKGNFNGKFDFLKGYNSSLYYHYGYDPNSDNGETMKSKRKEVSFCYNKGDTVTIAELSNFSGYIYQGNVRFFIPLTKPVATDVTNIDLKSGWLALFNHQGRMTIPSSQTNYFDVTNSTHCLAIATSLQPHGCHINIKINSVNFNTALYTPVSVVVHAGNPLQFVFT